MANLNDPAIQKRRKEAEKKREREREEALHWVMNDPRGRMFMFDLIFERCALMEVHKTNDSSLTRHEGKREVGYDLALELQESLPQHYMAMIAERQHDQAVVNATAAQNGEDDA